MAKMKESFPADVDYAVTLDTTDAVTAGMHEIVQTLLDAFVLVILVVYLFLQDWRATMIPMFAVPVSLVATFAVFPLFGFSVNTLSLFGLVLAIGLVVDDAIVVVEGIQHHIEEGLAPKEAARKAMEELTGPVVGIALVLSAVFVPTVFIPGITGRLYQQFALTIAISVIISAFNALTLSPALGALFLRPKKETSWAAGEILRLVQSHVCDAAAICTCGRASGLIRKSAVGRGGSRRHLASPVSSSGRCCPPASCPTRTRDTCTSRCNCPKRLPCRATSDAAREVEAVLKSTPGVQVHQHRDGIQPPQPHPHQLQRVLLGDAPAVGRPQDNGGAVSGHQGEAEPEAPHASPGHRLRLLSTGNLRSRHLGRIPVCAGRPRRQGSRIPGEQPEQVPRGRSQAARNRHGHHHVYTEHAAKIRVRGQGEGAEAGRQAQRCL